MLDLVEFKDDIYIYTSSLDEWGLPISGVTSDSIKGYIREVTELQELKNQKGKTTVVSYTVTLSNLTKIHKNDLVGFMVDGQLEKFEILKLRMSKDLSGEPTYIKVWL